jgi:hypothetical protein
MGLTSAIRLCAQQAVTVACAGAGLRLAGRASEIDGEVVPTEELLVKIA